MSRMLPGLIALLLAASFAGVAFYINVAEQPARLILDDRALLLQWKASYAAARILQAGTVLLAGAFALVAAWLAKDWRWVVGAAAMLANWPYTLVGMMPVNNALMAIAPEAAGSQARTLIEQWATLHAGRTGMGLLAVVVFLWTLSVPPRQT